MFPALAIEDFQLMICICGRQGTTLARPTQAVRSLQEGICRRRYNPEAFANLDVFDKTIEIRQICQLSGKLCQGSVQFRNDCGFECKAFRKLKYI